MGIKLLIDDFGTGYSSLSQLQKMDFDVLKVDQSFTSALNQSKESAVLFTAIITMAHSLDMRVVAEGVETLEQINTLKYMHCDEVQGYIYPGRFPSKTGSLYCRGGFFQVYKNVAHAFKPSQINHRKHVLPESFLRTNLALH